MEEALRESEAGFRDLADTAPAMMWTTGVDGLITFVNQGWLRFTGTTFQEEMGASWALGVHPDDADLVLSSWDAALAERRPWQGEYRLHHHSGEYRWIDDRGVPRYVGGRLRGLRGHGHRHPRAEDDGGAPARGLPARAQDRRDAPAQPAARAAAADRGLELAARYLPGARGAAIGGDWYDVLERPDGRVALVVGDVAGHGLRAAASMGQLRNAFRAYGLVEASPAEVVARINRLVMSGVEQVMATVLYLVLDRETGEVAFSAAGPSAAARDRAGRAALPRGRALGADRRRRPGRVPRGHRDPSAGLHAPALHGRARGAARHAARTSASTSSRRRPATAGDELGELCETRARHGARRRGARRRRGAPRGPPAPDGRRPGSALTLPAEPGSLAQLRRRLARFLHATGASEIERYEITLTICEAAGNAIEHAYGPGDATYEVEVAFDERRAHRHRARHAARWREKRGEHRGRGLGIIEDLMDEVAVERDDARHARAMRRRLREDQAA